MHVSESKKHGAAPYCTIRYGTVLCCTRESFSKKMNTWLASSKVVGFRFFYIESNNCLKWSGINVNKVGSVWICRIRDMAANYRSRNTLRNKSVRKRHTVSRCVAGLRTHGEEAKEKAVEKARDFGLIFLDRLLDTLRPFVLAYTACVSLPGNPAFTCFRSRSPANHAWIENNATTMTGLCGYRLATLFDDTFFWDLLTRE